MAKKIDGKFSTDGTRIFNTVSGVDIPDDEPIILFRGRDRNSLRMLRKYYLLCVEDGCNDLHLAGISQVIDKFENFAIAHPELMKQPGITKHLKLEAPMTRADLRALYCEYFLEIRKFSPFPMELSYENVLDFAEWLRACNENGCHQ